MNKRDYIMPALLVAIGSLQLIGYATGLAGIRKVGQLTAASPLPLVFSHFRGLETFSPRFFLVARSVNGETREIQVTPEMYSKIGGSYNRRNVYGVAFAFGAVLNEERESAMVASALSFGLCDDGPLRRLLEEEGLAASTDELSVLIQPKYGIAPKRLEVRCA